MPLPTNIRSPFCSRAVFMNLCMNNMGIYGDLTRKVNFATLESPWNTSLMLIFICLEILGVCKLIGLFQELLFAIHHYGLCFWPLSLSWKLTLFKDDLYQFVSGKVDQNCICYRNEINLFCRILKVSAEKCILIERVSWTF